MTNALGNYLKQLRQNNHLSQTGLAEQIQYSHAYIGFIEQGKRSPSDETLQKLALFFNVKLDELLKLRDQKASYPAPVTDNESSNSEWFPDIEHLANSLMMIDPESRGEIIEEIKEFINQKLYSLLSPYQLSEVKQKVLGVKRQWLDVMNPLNSSTLPFEQLMGRLTIEGKNIFFQMALDETALYVSFLDQERKHIHLIEK